MVTTNCFASVSSNTRGSKEEVIPIKPCLDTNAFYTILFARIDHRGSSEWMCIEVSEMIARFSIG